MPNDAVTSRTFAADKRRLRTEIARQRRRIDASRRGLRREAGKLVSWRTYVTRFPLAALGMAAGFGVIVATGLPQRVVGTFFKGYLLRAGLGLVSAKLWQEVLSYLNDSTRHNGPREDDAGRTSAVD